MLEISDKLDITHIVSFESERLELPKNLRIRGATEHWLGVLENGMFDSIKRHLKVKNELILKENNNIKLYF